MKKLLLIVFLWCLSETVFAQFGTITLVAGGAAGASGFAGDGGPATASGVKIDGANSVAVDTAGNVYVVDSRNYRIRKVHASTGIITTIAGMGTSGFSGDGGPAVVAQLNTSTYSDITVDRAGNVYIIDNDRVRKISMATGIISTVAGNGSTSYSGDGGAATSAGLNSPNCLFVDTAGNIFIGDRTRVRKVSVSTGIISLLAGTSSGGFSGDGGTATSAQFNNIMGITEDPIGNIFISDEYNRRIRKVNTSGIVTTVAGNGSYGYSGNGGPATAASLYYPQTIVSDTFGNIYFANYDQIRCVDHSSGLIHKVAGSTFGYYYTYYSYDTLPMPADSTRIMPDFICMDKGGSIFYTEGEDWVYKITHPASGINTFSLSDTLGTTPCTLPGMVRTGLTGTITITPASTDSVHVSIDYGAYVTPSIRNYALPYWFSSSYGFGSPFSNLSSFTYTLPGVYRPAITIKTAGGFDDSYVAPAITVSSVCGSGITDIRIDSVRDTILASPCSLPWDVKYNVWGHVTGTPTTGDSVFLVYQHNTSDTTYLLRKVPYTLSGTIYYFHDTMTRPYDTSASSSSIYFPTIKAITASGLYSSSGSMSYVYPLSCIGGHISASAGDTASHSPYCSLPITNRYGITGVLSDSAILATSVSVVINYGDGTIITTVAPVVYNSTGRYSFNISGLVHTYYIPGAYAPTFTVTAGIYTQTFTAPLRTFGSSCSPLSGLLYIDSNLDCAHQPTEKKLGYWPYAIINTTVGDTTYGWADDTGHYALNVVNGYAYTMVADPFGYFGYYGSAGSTLAPFCPASGIYSLIASGGVYHQDFAYSCTMPSTMDMNVSGWGWGFVPGDTGVIGLWSSNAWGYMCDTLSSTATLVIDTMLTYAGMWSGPAPSSISGDTLRWNFASSASLFEFNAMVKVFCHTTATIFDTVKTHLYVSPSRLTDPDLLNDTLFWREPVTSSWDPNEKQVSPVGYGPQGYIPNNTPLSYMIHFQNTGSAPARNILVSDSLSTYLDISTLQVLSSSSPVLVSQQPGNRVMFKFNNINLPDSASNPMGSIGYISFNIVPFDSLAPNTQITNYAGIYFDYNYPVYTNSITNTIEDTVGVIYGADTVCPGGSITLSNHISGGVWSCSNSRAVISDSGIVTGVTPGLDTVRYVVFGDQSAYKVIVIRPAPGLGAITGSHSVCSGSSVTLGATISGGTWSGTYSGRATISSAGVVTGLATGTDSVYYTSTNVCGSGRDAYNIIIDTTAIPGTITGAASLCTGASGTYMSSVSGGTWSSSSSTVATITGGLVTGLAVGTDTVVYTVTNSCGAVSTNAVVTIISIPYPGTISGPSAVCVGATVTLSPSGSGGVWRSGSLAIATVAGGNVTGLASGTDSVFYSLTNMCGTNSAYFVISVDTLPTSLAISGSSMVCIGDTIMLSVSLAGGAWTNSGSSATISSGVVTGIALGTTLVTYSVTNGCGTTIATQPVTIIGVPDAGTISGLDTICEGTTTTLLNSATGGTWSSSNAGVASISATGLLTGVAAGIVTITYSATNACGTSSTTYTIQVNALADCPEEIKVTSAGSNSLTIMPNPNSGIFMVDLPAHENRVSISISDVEGKAIKTLLITDNKQLRIPIDMTNYAAGVYLIKAELDGRVWRKKVVVM